MDLEVFELVLLRTPPDAPEYDEDESARIQREHLAFHDRLRREGTVVTNGPVLDQPDVSLRGLAFYRRNGATVRETVRLCRLDAAGIERLAQEG